MKTVIPLTVGDKGSPVVWYSYIFIYFPAGFNLVMTVDFNNSTIFLFC